MAPKAIIIEIPTGVVIQSSFLLTAVIAFVGINFTVLVYIGMKDPCEESHPRTAHRKT